MLVEKSLKDFSDVLASDSPAPGGGSVAALSGSLGADLVSMVCNLSIGKKDYVEWQSQLEEALKKSRDLSSELLERVDLDTQAFNGVMKAFKMPKETEDQKQQRKEAIQKGFSEAVQSPLAIAHGCLEVLKVAESLLGKSNTNAVSDLGVSSQQAYAGLEGAVMNVKINLPSIKDKDFVEKTSRETEALLAEGKMVCDKINRFVNENIG